MLEKNIVGPALGDAGTKPTSSDALGRLFDIAIALPALCFLGPVMLVTALLIALERRGPVLFRHERIGRDGKAFTVLKFRTMVTNGDEILARHLEMDPAAWAEWQADHKLRSDPRVSALGRILRSSSIDELPQLFNVLWGEMSIVGPRPITLAEIGKYGAHYESYCSVRPGITGMWQVNGRNDVSYQRRVEMDALYAQRKGVVLDFTLVMATIPAVLLRRGSY